VFPDVYVRRDQRLTLRDRAVAAWLWSHRQGVLAGLTAAAWHGSRWVDDDLPVELVWSNLRPPRGLRTYDFRLLPDEIRSVAGVPVTTPERTAFDIGRRKAMGMATAHWTPSCERPAPRQTRSFKLPTGIAAHGGSGS
jgi:hypothetical protein